MDNYYRQTRNDIWYTETPSGHALFNTGNFLLVVAFQPLSTASALMALRVKDMSYTTYTSHIIAGF